MRGEDLRKWRERMGWSQAEAAQHLKTPFRTYQRWEASDEVMHPVELATKHLTEHPPKTKR